MFSLSHVCWNIDDTFESALVLRQLGEVVVHQGEQSATQDHRQNDRAVVQVDESKNTSCDNNENSRDQEDDLLELSGLLGRPLSHFWSMLAQKERSDCFKAGNEQVPKRAYFDDVGRRVLSLLTKCEGLVCHVNKRNGFKHNNGECRILKTLSEPIAQLVLNRVRIVVVSQLGLISVQLFQRGLFRMTMLDLCRIHDWKNNINNIT